jgi:hypothetical protein
VKNYSVSDCLGREIRVGDICVTAFGLDVYADNISLGPVVITRINLLRDNPEVEEFSVHFVDRESRLEDNSISNHGRVTNLFKIENPEFYLQDRRIANLMPIRQEIIGGKTFQVKLPLF